MNKLLSFTLEAPEDRLDTYLARVTTKSRALIKEEIDKGNVLINQLTCTKASQRLKAGDTVELTFSQVEALDLKPVSFPLEILFEDESLLVINKPQGVVTHPAPGHRGETLVHYLLSHLENNKSFPTLDTERPGIVHRLDKGTSGVILIAKDRETQELLSSQFKNRETKKEYEALVWGKMLLEGRVNTPIGRDRKNRQKMSSRSEKTRSALTLWKTVKHYKHFTHVDLFPHTGRTHQLRVHLTETGHSIVADTMYGGANKQNRFPKMDANIHAFLAPIHETFLHAKKLSFTHPHTKKTLTLEAKRPKVFEELLKLLETYDL